MSPTLEDNRFESLGCGIQRSHIMTARTATLPAEDIQSMADNLGFTDWHYLLLVHGNNGEIYKDPRIINFIFKNLIICDGLFKGENLLLLLLNQAGIYKTFIKTLEVNLGVTIDLNAQFNPGKHLPQGVTLFSDLVALSRISDDPTRVLLHDLIHNLINKSATVINLNDRIDDKVEDPQCMTIFHWLTQYFVADLRSKAEYELYDEPEQTLFSALLKTKQWKILGKLIEKSLHNIQDLSELIPSKEILSSLENLLQLKQLKILAFLLKFYKGIQDFLLTIENKIQHQDFISLVFSILAGEPDCRIAVDIINSSVKSPAARNIAVLHIISLTEREFSPQITDEIFEENLERLKELSDIVIPCTTKETPCYAEIQKKYGQILINTGSNPDFCRYVIKAFPNIFFDAQTSLGFGRPSDLSPVDQFRFAALSAFQAAGPLASNEAQILILDLFMQNQTLKLNLAKLTKNPTEEASSANDNSNNGYTGSGYTPSHFKSSDDSKKRKLDAEDNDKEEHKKQQTEQSVNNNNNITYSFPPT